MRQIKFRARQVSSGKLETDLCLYLNGEVGDVSECFHNLEDKEDWVIEQFTGLVDKNGKEIYEGDICEYTPSLKPAEIVYSWALAAFVFDTSRRHNLDDKYGDYVPMNRDFAHYYEVVGNVFENPELLK